MDRDFTQLLIALNSAMKYNSTAAKMLIDNYNSLEAIFNLSEEELSNLFGKRYAFFDELKKKEHYQNAKSEYMWCKREGIEILSPYLNNKSYPNRMLNCYDYPILIYKKGEVDLNRDRIISIVGTRRSTQYGQYICEKIVEDIYTLDKDIIIVSGLAFGTDINVHKCSLKRGITNIAVLACGLDKIYPTQHSKYIKDICKNGAIISEYPRETQNMKINFLKRNRIIASLSDITIIIESAQSGGARITAQLANTYNRSVYAVPGRLNDILSLGCIDLISNNQAEIYCSAKKIFDNQNWEITKGDLLFNNNGHYEQNSKKRKILVALSTNSDLSIDNLSQRCGVSVKELYPALLELELEGRIGSNKERYYLKN